jgi:diguanylate cyclase (GGDEF)-like protein
VIDIDMFKSINDRFGHAIGDQVIIEIADLCRSHMRRTDLVARLGGEEFAMLLPETCLTDAVDLAERLRDAVSQLKLARPNALLGPTVSIGVSEAVDGAGISDLLKQADTALYDAKQAGRDRVSFGQSRMTPKSPPSAAVAI